MKKVKTILGILLIGICWSCSKEATPDDADNNSANYYQNKEVEVIFENDPENGINVIFMGDAYLRSDLKRSNGKYHYDAVKAIEFLFNSKPFSTYRNHFNAYVIYAESSIQSTANGIVVNYPFGSATSSGLFNNPYINNYEAVDEYVTQVKGRPMNSNDLVLMAINGQDGGTAYIGGNVAVFGTYNSTTNLALVQGTMLHEVGHAFASLGDEYNVPNADLTLYFQDMANLDVTNNVSTIKWSHFIGLNGYSSVGAYEGGGLQEFGIWRPEAISIMMGNQGSYFNAPSREAIVKKIMALRGIEYSFDAFLTLDAGNQANRVNLNTDQNKAEKIKCGLRKQ